MSSTAESDRPYICGAEKSDEEFCQHIVAHPAVTCGTHPYHDGHPLRATDKHRCGAERVTGDACTTIIDDQYDTCKVHQNDSDTNPEVNMDGTNTHGR